MAEIETVDTNTNIIPSGTPDNTVQGTQPDKMTDPFALDENSLASLSPEQRASLDPIFTTWKQKANEEISRRESEIAKYKPYEEKATALDKLTQYQPFQQWWQSQLKNAGVNASGQTVAQPAAAANVASPEEWQSAIYEASQGDGSKLQTLNARMAANMIAPVVRDLQDRQQKIDIREEMRDLFDSHPDAKELDSIGLDPKDSNSVSLLEECLDWAERNGKTLEDGYNRAKNYFNHMNTVSQQKAMGMVASKKNDITQGPSTNSVNSNLVTVESADELIKRSLEDQVNGIKDVRYVIKK